jgi:hypothetical protein
MIGTGLRRSSASNYTRVTVGAGHFHQLEVPERLTPMIERFVSMAT